jgi:hypothetical protein
VGLALFRQAGILYFQHEPLLGGEMVFGVAYQLGEYLAQAIVGTAGLLLGVDGKEEPDELFVVLVDMIDAGVHLIRPYIVECGHGSIPPVFFGAERRL